MQFQDVRRDYGEERIECLGLLQGRIVVIVYTKRSFDRHFISMRKANAREQRRFRDYVS
nr:BrnT family toxin [Synechococcus sp. MW101C3]